MATVVGPARLGSGVVRLGTQHMRRFIQLSLLATAVSVFAGCRNVGSDPSRVSNDSDGNFHLYISDQSFAISPVDISVFIDGELIVRENFYVGSQHNWQRFVRKLSPGPHRLVAKSIKGNTELDQTFEIKDKLWVSLDYWFYPNAEEGAAPCPRKFTLFVKEEPIMFQ